MSSNAKAIGELQASAILLLGEIVGAATKLPSGNEARVQLEYALGGVDEAVGHLNRALREVREVGEGE